MSALEAMLDRRSLSRVTDDAPTHDELLAFVAGAGRVADHKNLKPWRLIEIRGDDRKKLGRAIAKAKGKKGRDSKPLRAPLLIAVIGSYRHGKVPVWEQQAVATGVAHMLSLALDEAGYGVFWRTDGKPRKPVRRVHGLKKNEELLGWLYVGGKPERNRPLGRKRVDAASFLSRMP